MNRTAYIAGKITGLPKGHVQNKFNVVSNQLSGMGYEVITPDAVTDDSKGWDASVRNDIKKMLECDEVHLLPDWQDSKGAQLERDIALRLGMQVVYH
ncbi:MAG: hypothetical protein JWQ38_3263 [Flavipsychrobacter sp.]|nr:hypothetical protein [Flavipsychrobacter sp.]